MRARLAAAAVGVKLVPGLAAFGCAVGGVWVLAGLGWALLTAVPFLLAADARTT